MDKDVQLIITGTITVIIIAWVLVKAQQAGQVTNAAAGGYATAVKAILPQGS